MTTASTTTNPTIDPITIPAKAPSDSPLLSFVLFLFSVGLSLFVEKFPVNIIEHDLTSSSYASANYV